MEHGAEAYKDVILFLAAAGVVVPLFHRIRVSPVLGFLIAGVLIGPYGFGALAERFSWAAVLSVEDPELMAFLGEFGVVFLLFMIGLELSWERLKALRTLVFGLGAAQLALCAAALTGLALLLAPGLPGALVIGLALAMSSTAIVLPVLASQGRSDSATGQAALGVLLFQDIAVAPMLIGVDIAGRGGSLGEAVTSLGIAVGALVVLAVVLRLVLRPLMHTVAASRNLELFLAACLLIVIAAGLAAAGAGLSMALGAFVAGVLLGDTEYQHAAESAVEPFRGLLLGLFFVAVGVGLDLSLIAREPLVVLGLAAALTAIKAAIVFALGIGFRVGRATAAETALVLAPAGEFAFVLLDQASGARLLTPEVAELVLVSVTLSMFAVPVLAALGRRLGGAAVALAERTPPPGVADDRRVVIVGYGRVGRLVSDMLSRHGIVHRALDSDAARVRALRQGGADIWFGDGGQEAMLVRMGVDTAAALVVTLDQPGAAERVVAAARRLRPDLTIVVRARDEHHAHRLYEIGATDAVPETFEASLQLAENTLVDVGVPIGLVIASIHEKRDEVRAALNLPDDHRPRRSVRTSQSAASEAGTA